jgi:hypothetical protein
MTIISGVRALILLVMIVSMVVLSGCSNIMGLFLCRSEEFWDYGRFGCQLPDPDKVKAYMEKYDKCRKEGGEWIDGTSTCSYATRDSKAAAHKCEEEGGEWIPWTRTCSPAKNKEKAAEKAAGDNAAAKPDKLPDKSDTK